MKRNTAILIIVMSAFCAIMLRPWKSIAQQTPIFQVEEYVTIRWDGRDNTHVVRPNGKVEFLGQVLKEVSRPNRTDERAFYLNVAMNAMAKEGYVFAGRTENAIVMKRAFQSNPR